jgi:hypothetical protein
VAHEEPRDSAIGRIHGYWQYPTNIGVLRIVPHYGRYQAMLNDEIIGIYSTPRRALDATLRGTTSVSSNAIDAVRSGLPKDLRNWVFVQARRRNH